MWQGWIWMLSTVLGEERLYGVSRKILWREVMWKLRGPCEKYIYISVLEASSYQLGRTIFKFSRVIWIVKQTLLKIKSCKHMIKWVILKENEKHTPNAWMLFKYILLWPIVMWCFYLLCHCGRKIILHSIALPYLAYVTYLGCSKLAVLRVFIYGE